MDNPLQPLTKAWLAKIAKALEVKRDRFQTDADEAMRFYDGPYDFMYQRDYAAKSKGFVYSGDDDAGFPKVSFGMTVNKVAEMVQVFGPLLYHANPNRQVTPRELPLLPPEALMAPAQDPSMAQMQQQMYQSMVMQVQQGRATDQARATLLQHYLNYTPLALDLKTEARHAVDEALIKGLGLLYTEPYTPPGSQQKLVGSFWKSCDDLVIDPDVETLNDAKWVAVRCVHPVWEVEQQYGLEPGSLKANLESIGRQAEVTAADGGETQRRTGHTNDLLSYWKVYSKMGIGGKLSGQKKDEAPLLDGYGTYCYLVVADGQECPLNLRPEVLADPQAVMQAVQWPTPFWADDAWPFVPLSFHWVPREVWPQSHIKPALGELKFLQWVYSFLTSKIKTTCRDFIAVEKSLAEDIKTAILSGQDLELIQIDRAHGTIDKVITFLQHPPFNGDIWKVIEAVTRNFEDRVGLNELAYGRTGPTQDRSATETKLKDARTSVRSDDMANKVEDFMGQVARAEALCARWHLLPQDVAPIMGPAGAQWWAQFIVPSDPSELLHQLEYRIESGSVRKPNRDRDAANAGQAVQTLLPFYSTLALQAGQVGPLNTLIALWAKAMDLDPTGLMVEPSPPPPPPGPTPEQMQEEHSQGMGQRDVEHQQTVQQKEDQHQQAMRQQQEKHAAAVKAAKEKAAAKPKGAA